MAPLNCPVIKAQRESLDCACRDPNRLMNELGRNRGPSIVGRGQHKQLEGLFDRTFGRLPSAFPFGEDQLLLRWGDCECGGTITRNGSHNASVQSKYI